MPVASGGYAAYLAAFGTATSARGNALIWPLIHLPGRIQTFSIAKPGDFAQVA